MDENTKHIICFSGGDSSAVVAYKVAKKYGTKNMILLNHNINIKKEVADVKRFKKEVADFLKLDITYANIDGILDDELIPNQFDVVKKAGALTSQNGHHLCTALLKTQPFEKFLNINFKDKNCIIYYGFDKKEKGRVIRRSSIMAAKGYITSYPNFNWQTESGENEITSMKQLGIEPPNTYEIWEHANCIGCLKAGLLHWYVVYCTNIEIYREAIEMEEEVGYYIHSIKIKGVKTIISLKELMPLFCQIKALGVKANEHQNKIKFGRSLMRLGIEEDKIFKPCDCHV